MATESLNFSFQGLRRSLNVSLSQYEPVLLVLASVATWIALSVTSSTLGAVYGSFSEKGEIVMLLVCGRGVGVDVVILMESACVD